ncbi:MAG: lysostaphin resistance A-like protein [Huintestinicola sp.]
MTENEFNGQEVQENMTYENQNPEQPFEPANTDSAGQAILLKKKLKNGCNWTCGTLLIQLAIVLAVSIMISIVFSTVNTVRIMQENPNITQQELMEAIMESSSNPRMIITTNAVSYLIANISAFLIGWFATKKRFTSSILNKSKLPAGYVLLGVLASLGMQAISIIVQLIVVKLTGFTGVSEDIQTSMSFGDDTVANFIMVFYFVVIAAVTEELLLRGVVLKLLSPVSKTFALIASSLLFGIIHGNFNQMFNGFIIGLVLGYIALKSGSIIPSIICHMVCNANAMAISYYEYRISLSSESVSLPAAEMIWICLLLVLGIISAVVLIKKQGWVVSTDGYGIQDDVIVTKENESKLTWKLLLTSPTFWIFAVIYLIMAISMVTSTAQAG